MADQQNDMRPWARYWAKRYSWALEGRPYLDIDDLVSAATLGILRAQAKFDPDAEGSNWATFSSYFIRKEIRALIGIRDRELPPAAISLDEPIPGAEDEGSTRLDMLADESLPDIDARALLDDLCANVRDAIEELKDPRQKTIAQRWKLEGETQSAIAEDLNIAPQRVAQIWNAARRNLAKDRRLRAYADMELRTPYYKRIGPSAFNTTRTSPTEYAALWRIAQEQQIERTERAIERRQSLLEPPGG